MTKYLNIKYTLPVNSIFIAAIVIINMAGINCQVNGEAGDTESSQGGGVNNQVRYVVDIRKIEQTIAPRNNFWYMYYEISDNAPVTYFKRVTEDSPLFISEFLIMVNDEDLYSELPNDPNMVSVCAEYPLGSMEANIITILELAIMNNGTCPIEKGTYLMPAMMPGVTLIFNERIPCGSYNLILNLDARNEWVGQFEFAWNLDSGKDDCVPV